MDSKDERLTRMRHSASHIMAEAVLSLFPEAKFAIGPAIENGFYYDFDLPRSLTPEDLAVIEQKMREIIAADLPFEQEEVTKDEARRLFAAQPYKLELIDDVEGDTVSIYRQGGFVDLCAGPHVERTGEVKAFKLTNVAGAYWRGDEHRPMLQRIYGALFETQEELDDYLRRLEEAAAARPPAAGPRAGPVQLSRGVRRRACVYWHPKGARVRHIIEEFWRKEHYRRRLRARLLAAHRQGDLCGRPAATGLLQGEHVLADGDRRAGLLHQADELPVPHPDLQQPDAVATASFPMRLAELGTVYRYERSGVLHGLLRVRGFTQDDAHIFCRPDQVEAEIGRVARLHDGLPQGIRLRGLPRLPARRRRTSAPARPRTGTWRRTC